MVAAANLHRSVPCYILAIWGRKIGRVKVRARAAKVVVASGLGCGLSPMMVALFAVCYVWWWQQRQSLSAGAEASLGWVARCPPL